MRSGSDILNHSFKTEIQKSIFDGREENALEFFGIVVGYGQNAQNQIKVIPVGNDNKRKKDNPISAFPENNSIICLPYINQIVKVVVNQAGKYTYSLPKTIGNLSVIETNNIATDNTDKNRKDNSKYTNAENGIYNPNLAPNSPVNDVTQIPNQWTGIALNPGETIIQGKYKDYIIFKDTINSNILKLYNNGIILDLYRGDNSYPLISDKSTNDLPDDIRKYISKRQTKHILYSNSDITHFSGNNGMIIENKGSIYTSTENKYKLKANTVSIKTDNFITFDTSNLKLNKDGFIVDSGDIVFNGIAVLSFLNNLLTELSIAASSSPTTTNLVPMLQRYKLQLDQASIRANIKKQKTYSTNN